MNVQVTQLGLAAYMKLKGAKLLAVHGRSFVFETDVPLRQWHQDYDSSESKAHDAIVCDFRSYRRNGVSPTPA